MGYSLETAAEIYREALRETVERNTLLYISEGALLAVIGLLAIVYPLFTVASIAVALGWLLIVTAVLQASCSTGCARCRTSPSSSCR